MQVIREIETSQIRDDLPEFSVGDTVAVRIKIVEGEKSLKRLFKGVVISNNGGRGQRATFTVRKISGGIGVERTFPVNSPSIIDIKVLRKGKVKQSKIFYLRKRTGKAAKIKERR